MARFEFDVSQMDGNIATRLGKIHDVKENAAFDEVLKTAGERLAEHFRSTLMALGMHTSKSKRATNQLINSIKPTMPKILGNNAKYVDVYPQGTRKKRGIRNAMVGFVHEYGTSNNPARHWMSNTVDDVGDEIAGIVADGVSQIIDKELGG